jgi:hypothetical protein
MTMRAFVSAGDAWPSGVRKNKTPQRCGALPEPHRTAGGSGGIGAAVATRLLSISSVPTCAGSTCPAAAINRSHHLDTIPSACGDRVGRGKGARRSDLLRLFYFGPLPARA